MIQRIDKNTFHDIFEKVGGHGFSYEGLDVLFDHLQDLEEDIGEEMELDPIAIRSQYSEYKNLNEFINDNYDHSNVEDFIKAEDGISDEEFEEEKEELMENFAEALDFMLAVDDMNDIIENKGRFIVDHYNFY